MLSYCMALVEGDRGSSFRTLESLASLPPCASDDPLGSSLRAVAFQEGEDFFQPLLGELFHGEGAGPSLGGNVAIPPEAGGGFFLGQAVLVHETCHQASAPGGS